MTFRILTVLILSAGLTAGCGIDPPILRNDCDWAEPIRPSRQDALSDGTRLCNRRGRVTAEAVPWMNPHVSISRPIAYRAAGLGV